MTSRGMTAVPAGRAADRSALAGAELLASPRGTDVRFADIGDRPTRTQKREEQQERRDAKAAARAELEAERKAGIWTESVSGRRAPQPVKESGMEADDDL